MSTNVDSISGKCKVNISVDCPCKLSVQGQEIDAVPGDLFTVEVKDSSFPAAFFIGVKDVSSVLSRVIVLRSSLEGFREHEPASSCSSEFRCGYRVARNHFCMEFINELDAIIKDYSL